MVQNNGQIATQSQDEEMEEQEDLTTDEHDEEGLLPTDERDEEELLPIDEHDEEELLPSPGEESDVGEQEEENEPEADNYFTVLSKLADQWLNGQLTHSVSASATNFFWDIAMKYIPLLSSLKTRDNLTRKTPSFTQERKKLFKDHCPGIKMRYGFKHKATGAVETVDCGTAQAKTFEKNQNYVKVYEEAHVEVIKTN